MDKAAIRGITVFAVATSMISVACIGCIEVDGDVRYVVRGSLVDSARASALAGAMVSATADGRECRPIGLDNHGYGGHAVSDEHGRFECIMVESEWHRTLLLGVIPVGGAIRLPPPPPPLEILTLHVYSDGRKTDIPIEVPRSRQREVEPARRALDLGSVSVPRERNSE